VIGVAFLLNTSYAIAKPALVSLVPALVPRDELADAVGVNTLQFVSAQMAGPVLAALVIAGAGVAWAFALNAVSYLGPIIAMLYLRGIARGAGPAGAAGTRRAMSTAGTAAAPVSALAYIRQNPWVVALLVGVIATSAQLEFVRTLSPAIAEGLGQPESAAGFLIAAQSLGSALAILAFIPLRRSGRDRDLARVALVLQGAGLLLTAIAWRFEPALVAGVLLGAGFSLCFPVLTSTLQAEVPDAVRGRVMAFHQMSHLGNRPFAALLAGSSALILGAQPAVAVGIVLVPIGLAASARAWRSLDAMRASAGRPPGAPSGDRPGIPGPASTVTPAVTDALAATGDPSGPSGVLGTGSLVGATRDQRESGS
jgi:hypothetical protein